MRMFLLCLLSIVADRMSQGCRCVSCASHIAAACFILAAHVECMLMLMHFPTVYLGVECTAAVGS